MRNFILTSLFILVACDTWTDTAVENCEARVVGVRGTVADMSDRPWVAVQVVGAACSGFALTGMEARLFRTEDGYHMGPGNLTSVTEIDGEGLCAVYEWTSEESIKGTWAVTLTPARGRSAVSSGSQIASYEAESTLPAWRDLKSNEWSLYLDGKAGCLPPN